ncbi:hypothetical protein [Mucilaginibacter agri]|uniref:Fimbrillin-A associated anchor protein Mfa1 and Mfa2 n=1 Tax=Mucilaginibacter agri TaxID=2695265 RepID=A0A965ZM66_9SPHI|nr:hypothetical protein [Mucilaginibacter agri]NCD72256.1 hypothetical protein [Mucilaginibacter agri]
MKANFTLLMIFVLALASCKKDNTMVVKNQPDPTVAVTKYPVSFSASAFSSQTSAFGTKAVTAVKQTQALKDVIKVLSYYVTSVDSPGIIIKKVVQKSTDANFGTIRDTLPNGNYRVVFLGSTGSRIKVGAMSFDYEVPVSQWDLYASDDGSFFRSDSIGDNFAKVLNLTVNARTNYDVVMERIVGKAKVVIQDAIPTNVARIDCLWQSLPGAYDLFTGTPNYGNGGGLPILTFHHQVTPAEIGKKGFTFGVTTFATSISIQLFAYDAAGNQLYTRYVSDNTQIDANTMVTFTGTLFDNSQSANVSANPVWGGSTTLPFTDY